MTSPTLYDHLEYINNLLTQNSIKYWITGSTLLGAIRDNDVIPNDDIIHIATNIDNVNNILSLNPQIRHDRYIIYKQYADAFNFYNPHKKITTFLVTLKIDYNKKHIANIHLYKQFQDGFMRRFDTVSQTYFWPSLTYPSWFTERLSAATIQHILLPTPRDPEILLEYWYGKNWQSHQANELDIGQVVPGRNYFGHLLNRNITLLTNYLTKKYKLSLQPRLDTTIKYIFPPEDKNWLILNDMTSIQ